MSASASLNKDTFEQVDFFLKNSSDWFWEADTKFRFTYSNGRLETWLNLPDGLLIGKKFEDLAQQDPDVFSFLTEIADALVDKPFQDDLRVELRKKGESEFSALLDLRIEASRRANRILGYKGIGHHRVIESSISSINAPLETLFSAVENSPNGILITGKDGKIEYANPGFCKISGYSREECYGHTPRIFQSGKTDQLTYVRLWKAIASGRNWEGVVQNKRKNGEYYWSEETISPVMTENGDISHYIAIQQDVTEKVKAEQDLRLSEERFKGFTDAASDWYWEMDKDLSFSYFSDSASLYSGIGIEEMLGDRRENLVTLPQDKEKWNQHYKDLKARKAFKDFEYIYVRPDGNFTNFLISGKPVFSDEGSFDGYRGVGRDVTQRKLLEEQLRQSQKMDVIGQLAGGVAHDFNNILAIISGNAELLKEKMEQAGPPLNAELNNIIYSADRGAALTSQILAFSRKQLLSPVSVNLNKLIQDMRGILASSLNDGIELEINTFDSLWSSFIDPQQVTNAILNACINARDAMKGKGELVISTENTVVRENSDITCIAPGDYVLLSIQDTGEGIHPENLSKVFEPFFTTKPVGKGTGLGLSMLFGFAKQSGGGVALKSDVGVGTTLKLYLPKQDID